jgi:hypothetical protein
MDKIKVGLPALKERIITSLKQKIITEKIIRLRDL